SALAVRTAHLSIERNARPWATKCHFIHQKSRSAKAWVLPSFGNSLRPQKRWTLERCQGRPKQPSVRAQSCWLVASTNRLAGCHSACSGAATFAGGAAVVAF